MNKTPWERLRVNLFDSDGGNPNDEQFRRAMAEFLATDSIQGYFFADVSKPADKGEDLYFDPWNNEYRHSWECGPDVADIDWSGFDV